MKPDIELIIPAYNEEKRIAATLRAYSDYFKKKVTLHVVLNGCTDNTKAVVTEVQKEYPAIKMTVIDEAVGKGGAIIEGWRKSSADIVGFVDADMATPPHEFAKLLEKTEAYPIVIASRFMLGSRIVEREGFLRSSMSRVFQHVVKVLFWMPYTDTQCGAKVVRRSTLSEVLPELKQTGMVFDVELLWRLFQKKHIGTEVPTIWTDQPGSAALHSKQAFLTTGLDMVKRLWHIRFGK